MRVSRYMTSPVITARLNDNLAYIRNLMLKHGVGRIVIVDEGFKPISIITKSDLVRIMMSKEWRDRPLESVYVGDVKGPMELKLATPRMSIKRAANIMVRNLISGLPVVTPITGGLVGIITKTDMLRAFVDGYRGMYLVRDLMTKHPIVVRRTHSVFRIQELLAKYNISRVIVVDDDRPVGVVTETDVVFTTHTPTRDRFVKQRVRQYKDREVTVRIYMVPVAEDIMTPNPVVVGADEDATKAAELMMRHGSGGLPVVDGERLVGIITKTDIVMGIAGVKGLTQCRSPSPEEGV
ncbi:MAG: CBS domain-containing protein [Candidatus Nezhaarchaeota archaeon]|nr:CBS domain-containing protein [Candidatus Nezhaarchaeota archaeon]MCX8141272.1 CBS domain-containing protein [Candidatus Nezhaarchaeota archaeon]MDW8049538.1 CBS domain-containing protein [Nitrososphaerota archaeon]